MGLARELTEKMQLCDLRLRRGLRILGRRWLRLLIQPHRPQHRRELRGSQGGGLEGEENILMDEKNKT